MKLNRVLRPLAALVLMVAWLFAARPAFAWPDQPPEHATLSGPGLKGEIEITDQDSLVSLRLGGLEDFDRGVLAAPPPMSGEGYQITRYFYDGTFNFAHLTYYPDPAGGPGYVHWQDGPDLSGDHTPYDGQWLYATPAGEAALKRLLAGLSASPPASSAPAPPRSLTSEVSAEPLIVLIGLMAAALAGSVLALRRKPARVRA